MSALAKNQSQPLNSNTQPGVTSISTNARVDYILRFSKQAILVVDQDDDVTSAIAGQYLGSLTEQQNCAYLAISPQLNNIQIRCRIVEQLFGNALFDPEVSLAVSILNFAKNSQQAISIVVEQAQNLSLQIIHELSQLAQLAKKTNIHIDVVMLGTPEAGKIVADSKNLFTGKISILAGDSGQLLGLNSALFKASSKWFTLSKPALWLIFSLVTITFAFTVTLELHQRGVISFSELISTNENKIMNTTFITTSEAQIKLTQESAQQEQVAIIEQVNVSEEINTVADRNEIFTALIAGQQEMQAVDVSANSESAITPVEALVNDASTTPHMLEEKQLTLSTVEQNDTTSNIAAQAENKVEAVGKLKRADIATLPVLNNRPEAKTGEMTNNSSYASQWQTLADDQRVSAQYYLQAQSGYVVQLAGFTLYEEYEKFTNTYQLTDFKAYFRSLNGKAMLVISSNIYPTRLATEQALAQMPEALRNAGIWIKSLAVIKSEINGFTTAIH